MNASNNQVSVVIPVYNAMPCFVELLDDLSRLKGADIILVDDCSSDGSREKALAFASSREHVTVISHVRNLGTMQTRCDGVRAVQTPYVMFADADDRLPDPEAPLKLARLMEKSGVDVTMFPSKPFFPDKSQIPAHVQDNLTTLLEFQDPPHDHFFSAINTIMNGPILWNKIFRTQHVLWANNLLTGTSLSLGEDQITLFLIFTQVKTVAATKEGCYYHYRIGSGISTRSFSTPKRFQLFLPMLDGWLLTRSILREQGLWDEFSADWEQAYSRNTEDVLGWWLTLPDSDEKRAFLPELVSRIGDSTVSLRLIPPLLDQTSTLKTQVDTLYHSTRWKIGGIFTALPRKLKAILSTKRS